MRSAISDRKEKCAVGQFFGRVAVSCCAVGFAVLVWAVTPLLSLFPGGRNLHGWWAIVAIYYCGLVGCLVVASRLLLRVNKIILIFLIAPVAGVWISVFAHLQIWIWGMCFWGYVNEWSHVVEVVVMCMIISLFNASYVMSCMAVLLYVGMSYVVKLSE